MLSLVIFLIVIGVALYLVNKMIPMDGNIKTILNVVAVIAVLIYVANAFGVFGSGGVVGVPHLR